MAIHKRFTSYSANFEDVILNRVFKDQGDGFFVDVGAAHPVFENDLKALYDRGWRGINIEPIAAFFDELSVQRPEDCNLNVAVSESSGEIVIYEVVGTGLSTCEPEAVEHARQQGYDVISRRVPTKTLREILTDAAAPTDISLLKVDVEGLELSVLRSNDWDRFRPKLILVEATFPETPVRRSDHVRRFLEAQGYRYVYFDGLNEFFTEENFAPPDGAFTLPPNVFDGFKLFTQQIAEDARNPLATEVLSLRAQIEQARKELTRVERHAEASATDLAAARAELAAMHEHNRALASDQAQEAALLRSQIEQARKELTRVGRHAEASATDLAAARAELAAIHERAGAIASDREQAEVVAAQLRNQLHAMYHSTSWKITRPLRAIVQPHHAMRLIARRLGL